MRWTRRPASAPLSIGADRIPGRELDPLDLPSVVLYRLLEG